MEYSDYAISFEKFIEKYPYFTVETSGLAKSDSTFGDVGKGNFGTILFETKFFNTTDFNRKYIIYLHKKHFTFAVGTEIGIGFKKDDKNLYIQPFVNGWIYSFGGYRRELSLALSVTKISFKPKK